MTLIELLIAMLMGLGVTLAVSSMVVVGENHKRTTTSTNDAEQTGAYAVYALDRMVRSAGSGFADSAYPTDQGVLGCKLNAAGILPRAAGSAFPAPFAVNFLPASANNLRIAPLLIGANQSDDGRSDVLVVMSGSGAAGGVPRQITIPGTPNAVTLDNTVGFAANDLAIVSQSGTPDCLLEQVTASAPSTLNLTGGLYSTVGSTTTLASFVASTASYVTPVGNADANNVQFQLLTVDATRTLVSYDLLQNLKVYQGSGAVDAVQALADGVDQIHALYGIDAPGGTFSTWVNPVAPNYDINTVMTTPATMRTIISARIAIVVRGQYYDKNLVSPPTLTWFTGLTDSTGAGLPALAQSMALSVAEQHYRYRVFETTVPLRNMLLLAQAP